MFALLMLVPQSVWTETPITRLSPATFGAEQSKDLGMETRMNMEGTRVLVQRQMLGLQTHQVQLPTPKEAKESICERAEKDSNHYGCVKSGDPTLSVRFFVVVLFFNFGHYICCMLTEEWLGEEPEMPWSCMVGLVTISALSLQGDSESA